MNGIARRIRALGARMTDVLITSDGERLPADGRAVPAPAERRDLAGDQRALRQRFAVPENYREWYADVPLSPRPYYRALLIFLLLFLGTFGVWAVAAPIGGATIVAGQLIASGRNQIVQHLEGGILTEVLVREGDYVEAGQALGRIDPSQAQVNLSIAAMQRDLIDVQLARFDAERRELAEIAYSDDLLARADQNVSILAAIETQQAEFAAKTEEIRAQRAIYQRRIQAGEEYLSDMEAVRTERQARVSELQSEIAVYQDLLDRGLTTRERVFSLTRQLSLDQEQMETLLSNIDERQSRIEQDREALATLNATRLNEINERILALGGERYELETRVTYYSGVVNRTTITAPVSGYIVQISANTANSVVQSGEALFEIFPADAALAVEALISTRDIGVISEGQQVEIRIPSQSRQQSLQVIDASVNYISYDAIPEETTGMPMYRVRAVLDAESLAAYSAEYGFVRPGAVVEAYFISEPQNFIEYALGPILLMKDRAFAH